MADRVYPAVASGTTDATAGPRAGLLAPDDERQFQTFMAFDPAVRDWRSRFRQRYDEAPQIEGGDFDYRQAWQAGRPRPVPGDAVPHWGSVGKAASHPTAWKQEFMTAFGIDPDELAPHQVTPAMQQFMQRIVPGLLGEAP